MKNFKLNTPGVTYEMIDGEAIIINLDSGYYYNSQKLGALIWECLSKGASKIEIIEKLSEKFSEYKAQVSEDIEEFVKKAISEKLLIESTEADSGISIELKGFSAYEKPVINKYEDMQDLLLLDPVHDVSEKGWPHKPEDKE